MKLDGVFQETFRLLGQELPKRSVRAANDNPLSVNDNPLSVTDADFYEEVLCSSIPVLVDFWAPWSGPCRMIAPTVDEIARQYEGKVKVVKLNTDSNPQVASKYGIRSLPTLTIFKGGQRVDMVVGAAPRATLVDALEKCL